MLTRLRDLRVATKLTAGFGVVCVLLVVLIVVAATRLANAQSNLDDLYSSSMASVSAVDDVKANFLQMNQDLPDIALAQDDAATSAAEQSLTRDDQGSEKAWTTYEASASGASASLRATARDLLDQQDRARPDAIALATLDDPTQFIAYRAQNLTPLTAKVVAALDELADAEDTAAAATRDAGAAAYRSALTLMIALGALSVAFALTVAVLISRSIAGPLGRAVVVMEGLAQGRLDQRVAYTAK
ncbi:MCP four helix bundle domain-containing protein, partial [Kineococcus sp. NPDC059986]|uniref:MCP four helix bundle domain-containing protein n=1 Tax=Kineococcus sp. NPDC059986 TaxID=3155538 RepID=UPI00344C9260